jgi:hypothetical protein
MKRTMPRVLVLAGLASIALASIAATPFSLAATMRAPEALLVGPNWHLRYQAAIAGSAAFTTIEATGRDSAWAAGVRLRGHANASAFAAHWNGRRWRLAALPIRDFTPVTIAAGHPADPWIFGYVLAPAAQPVTAGVALHLVGGRWHTESLPAAPANTWNEAGSLLGVAFGRGDAWFSEAVENGQGQEVTTMWEGSGSPWAASTIPAAVNDVSGTADTDLWAVGGTSIYDSPERIYRYQGGDWRRVPGPALYDASIAVHSPTDVWLTGYSARQWGQGGDSTVARWNGSRWTRYTVTAIGGPSPAAADGRGGVWAGPLLHETGGKWYAPASGWVFGSGCEPAGFFGGLAAIPGTSATWAASGCSYHGGRVLARISINGRL